MGRVSDPPPTAAPLSAPLKHFTHPHELHPVPFYNPQSVCSGCKLRSSGTMYTCIPCAFTLHQSCATLPQLITHPSHGGCTLSLLAVSSYPGGVFNCNACSRRGDAWNYHCPRCEYDLHVTCALKPLRIKHYSHTSCALELTFKNPYANSGGFSCDICRKIGSKQWLYRCNSCEFDVHLDCTTAPPQAVLQHQHSAPPPLMNSSSTTQAPLYAAAPPVPQQPHLVHSVSTGAIGNPYGANMYYQNPGQRYGSLPGNPQIVVQNDQAARGGGLGGNIMAVALQGFVEGAFQEVGQTVMQEVIGCGGGGGGGGGGGDEGGGDMSSY